MTPIFFVGFEVGDETEVIPLTTGSVVFGSTAAEAHGAGAFGTRYVTISGDGTNVNYVYFQDLDTNGAWKNLGYSPMYTEFALKVLVLPTVGQSEEVMSVWGAAQKLALRISGQAGGSYRINLHDRLGNLLASGTTDLTVGTYYWIGLMYTNSSSLTGEDGTYELRLCAVGGTPVVEFSGSDGPFRLAMGTTVFLGNRTRRATSAFSVRFDDVVVSGDGFAGECYAGVLPPTGGGYYNQWAGDYVDVDEIPPDQADFIWTGLYGRRESYAYADLPAPSVGMSHSILGVKGYWQSIWEGFAAGYDSVIYFIRVGSTNYEAASDDILGADLWTARQVVWPVNPATSGAWPVSVVDVLQVGIYCSAAMHHIDCCSMLLNVLLKEIPATAVSASDQGCYTLGG